MAIIYFWIGYLLLMLFILGSAVGSFLNVCIARLPRGMSLISPGSHCFSCKRAIPLRENIPLISYWLLRGRCRQCGAIFSVRYFWVELFTGILFAGTFLLEAGLNIHRYSAFGGHGLSHLEWASFRGFAWGLVLFHFFWYCVLLVIAFINAEHGRVPGGLVVVGFGVALAFAVVYPWPYPEDLNQAVAQPATIQRALPESGGLPGVPRGAMPAESAWSEADVSPRPGFMPWPMWGPLPEWLPPGSVSVGLATGLFGGAMGLLLSMLPPWKPTRGTPWMFALGGMVLGWQSIFVVFVLALGMTLLLRLVIRLDLQQLWNILIPISLLVVWFGWSWLSGLLFRGFFHPGVALMGILVALGIAIVRVLGQKEVYASNPRL